MLFYFIYLINLFSAEFSHRKGIYYVFSKYRLSKVNLKKIAADFSRRLERQLSDFLEVYAIALFLVVHFHLVDGLKMFRIDGDSSCQINIRLKTVILAWYELLIYPSEEGNEELLLLDL